MNTIAMQETTCNEDTAYFKVVLRLQGLAKFGFLLTLGRVWVVSQRYLGSAVRKQERASGPPLRLSCTRSESRGAHKLILINDHSRHSLWQQYAINETYTLLRHFALCVVHAS